MAKGGSQSLLDIKLMREEGLNTMGNNTIAKPSTEILERLRECSTEHKDEVFTRLYRYLLREDIYIAAYQNIYANGGAMTKGIDNDTAVGFGFDYVHDLIRELKSGTYRAKPVRRVYIPKKNGKMRPLGVPSFRDKLLQDVIRMYLEAIYEPLFDDCSHGFRPGKSCHTAFAQIRKTFNAVPWIIEGDISRCFDDIDHDILIGILGRKIRDDRLLQVIRQFLKAGYMEDWDFHETYSGAAQGGIISPILMNIYMNELDKAVRAVGEWFSAGSDGRNKVNSRYASLRNRITALDRKIAGAEGPCRRALLDERRSIEKQLRQTPSRIPTMKKICYVRYADDWLIGVHGSKADCEQIKSLVSQFLKQELHLTLSEEKTLITHSDRKIRFLGYDISVTRSQQLRRSVKTGRLSRSLYKHVVFSVPMEDKIVPYMLSKKAVIQRPDGTLRPRARTELLFARDDEIVRTYNSEIRGILNYYNKAGNYHKLGYFRYLMEYSCLYTLARKHNKSVRQIIRMYADNGSWSVPYKTKTGTKRIGLVSLDSCKGSWVSDSIKEYQPYRVRELWRRISRNDCEYCGVHSEKHCKVFQVRRLKDLGTEPWAVTMKRMRRKTLVVCPACYNIIHNACIPQAPRLMESRMH